jgi:circadian clock protein KaiB
MRNYILKLYITGNTPRSQRAIANLFRICSEELGNQYKVEIIDVLEQPQRAEDEKIMVTPTLIKQLPPPLQRIIGDMSNIDSVLLGLDLLPKDTEVQKTEVQEFR